MANALKGEYALIVKGDPALSIDDREYTLVIDTEALCQMESTTGKSVAEFIGAKSSVTVLRAMLWCALQAKHPEIDLTAAGDLIPRLGIARTTVEILGAMQAGGWIKPSPAKVDAPKVDPPKPGPRKNRRA